MDILSDSSFAQLERNQARIDQSPSFVRDGNLSHGWDDFIDLCPTPVSNLSLVAQGLWWFSFLLDLALIAGFTVKFACPGKRVNATPSWTVLYVGIAVAALTYPLVGIIEIAYATLSFGFLLTFLSLPAYL